MIAREQEYSDTIACLLCFLLAFLLAFLLVPSPLMLLVSPSPAMFAMRFNTLCPRAYPLSRCSRTFMTQAVVCGSDAGGPPQTMPTVAYGFRRDHDSSEALYHDLRSRCVGITPQTLTEMVCYSSRALPCSALLCFALLLLARNCDNERRREGVSEQLVAWPSLGDWFVIVRLDSSVQLQLKRWQCNHFKFILRVLRHGNLLCYLSFLPTPLRSTSGARWLPCHQPRTIPRSRTSLTCTEVRADLHTV